MQFQIKLQCFKQVFLSVPSFFKHSNDLFMAVYISIITDSMNFWTLIPFSLWVEQLLSGNGLWIWHKYLGILYLPNHTNLLNFILIKFLIWLYCLRFIICSNRIFFWVLSGCSLKEKCHKSWWIELISYYTLESLVFFK